MGRVTLADLENFLEPALEKTPLEQLCEWGAVIYYVRHLQEPDTLY